MPGSFPGSRSNPATLPECHATCTTESESGKSQNRAFHARTASGLGARSAALYRVPARPPAHPHPGARGSSPRRDNCSAGGGEPTCPLRGGPFPGPRLLVAAKGRRAHWAEAPQGPGRRAAPAGHCRWSDPTAPPPRSQALSHASPRVTLPSRGRSIVPGFAQRWGLGHG